MKFLVQSVLAVTDPAFVIANDFALQFPYPREGRPFHAARLLHRGGPCHPAPWFSLRQLEQYS